MSKLVRKDTGEVLLKDLKEADTFLKRLKGLMGKTSLPEGTGIRIAPCSSIHCFFMKMSIDALFLDENLCVVHRIFDMKPWTLSKPIKGSRSVIETESGALKGKVQVGDCLSIQE